MIFKKLHDPENRFDQSDVIIRTSALTLPDILEDFADFLRGCGFSINGVIDVVEDDLEEKKED
jgi:hypothetical protein